MFILTFDSFSWYSFFLFFPLLRKQQRKKTNIKERKIILSRRRYYYDCTCRSMFCILIKALHKERHKVATKLRIYDKSPKVTWRILPWRTYPFQITISVQEAKTGYKYMSRYLSFFDASNDSIFVFDFDYSLETKHFFN